MQQVTGVVIGGTNFEWMTLGLRREQGEDLGDVFAPRGELTGLFGVLRIISKKVAVLLEVEPHPAALTTM